MKTLSTLTLAAAAALAAGTANAQFQERTLRMGNTAAKDHPVAAGVAKLSECTLAKSGGKLKVQGFFDGVLGADLPSLAAVRTGTIDMMGVSTAPVATVVPELGVFDLPFLFSNEKEADTVLDGKVGDWFNAKLPAVGLVNLAWWENGFRHATNSKRPITKLEDFSGIKMRVMQNKVFLDTFSALGTNAVPLAFTEVYSALETKTVDGQENPTTTIQAMKFNEVQKYLSLTKHAYSPNMVLVSKKIWDTLSPQEQGVLRECSLQGRDTQRKVNREKGQGSVEAMKKEGLQVNEISAAEMARIRERTKPIYESSSKTITPEAMAQVLDELKRIRGQ